MLKYLGKEATLPSDEIDEHEEETFGAGEPSSCATLPLGDPSAHESKDLSAFNERGVGARAQEIDETGSSTGDKNIQVREVVIERPLKEGNPVNNSNTKSCNEDSTSMRTTAEPVDDVKGDEETTLKESLNKGEINEGDPLHSRSAVQVVTFVFPQRENFLGTLNVESLEKPWLFTEIYSYMLL